MNSQRFAGDESRRARWSRRRAVLAPLVALLGLIVAPMPAAAASYTYPCTGYLLDQAFIARGAGLNGSGTDYTGIIGDAYVRALGPCTFPTTTD